MPILVQVCIAIATIALVALAVAVVRTMSQLQKTAAQAELTLGRLEHAIPEVERTVVEVRGVVASLGQVAERVDRVSGEFATAGSRLARASTLVIDEVIDPATKVAALVRGVRTGAGVLVGSFLKRRGLSASASSEGGNHHE